MNFQLERFLYSELHTSLPQKYVVTLWYMCVKTKSYGTTRAHALISCQSAKYGKLTTEMSLSHKFKNFKPTSPTKKLYQTIATPLEFYTDHDKPQKKDTNQW